MSRVGEVNGKQGRGQFASMQLQLGQQIMMSKSLESNWSLCYHMHCNWSNNQSDRCNLPLLQSFMGKICLWNLSSFKQSIFCEVDKFKCICEILTDFYTFHGIHNIWGQIFSYPMCTPLACLYCRDLKRRKGHQKFHRSTLFYLNNSIIICAAFKCVWTETHKPLWRKKLMPNSSIKPKRHHLNNGKPAVAITSADNSTWIWYHQPECQLSWRQYIYDIFKKNMTHSQMFQNVESGWGPIFKVVLEC